MTGTLVNERETMDYAKKNNVQSLMETLTTSLLFSKPGNIFNLYISITLRTTKAVPYQCSRGAYQG